MKYTCPSSICFSRLAGEYIQSIMKSICSLERRSRYVAGKSLAGQFMDQRDVVLGGLAESRHGRNITRKSAG